MILAFVSIALGSLNQVFAYSWETCLGDNLKWRSNTVTMQASPVSFPPGSDWRAGLQNGVNGINLNRSNFHLQLTTDSGGVATGNDRNEAWFSRNQSILDGAPAVTRYYYTCFWFFGNIVHLDEADVIFHTSAGWTPYNNKSSLIEYSGRERLLSGTAAHEFGHALGIHHENRFYNIMGTDFQHVHVNGSTARTYAGVDAGDGTAFLYGTRSGSWEDVGVVHWKYAGTSGEYSRHTKTKFYGSAGNELPNTIVGGESGYWVTPGQVIRAEFTYENSGKSSQNVKIGYYISTNDSITTLDRRIAGVAQYGLNRNAIVTTTVELTIPSDLIADENYWLGVIVDEDDSITEDVEWNNATYLPLKIVDTGPRDDHGNDRITATFVDVPSSTSGEVEVSGDVDVFRFHLSQASRLEVRTTGSTDTFGTLYRDGSEVDADDDGGTDFNFLIGVPAAPAGTYYVEVKGFSATTGSYTLEIAAEDVDVHVLPFLPGAPRSADGTLDWSRPHQSGVVIVSNLSGTAGELVLEGVDGGGVPGRTLQPIELEPYESLALRVFDLETGSEAHGISPGLGDGLGDWWLRVISALPLDVSAYTGGWGHGLTPLAPNTTVPDATDASGHYSYTVSWFNPGSNLSNRSILKVVNTGDSLAQIRVSGHDAAGQPSLDEARFTVGPGQGRRVYANWLENLDGGAPVNGGLGDGSGKWRLTVTSDVPVYVLGLSIASEDGIISNLSR